MSKIQDLRSITPRTNGTRKESAIKHIARHHSATSDGDWSTFWPYWNKSKGWGTGGYAEIILRDGTVQLCYDPIEITNGVANHNSTTYHICIVGNGSFTAAQEKAWEERCLYNLERFGLLPKDVKGHREFSGTSTFCPGIDMGMVRNRLVFLQTKVSNPVVESEKPSEVKGVSIVEVYKKVASAGKSLIKGQEFVVENKLSDGTYPERPLTRAEFWETLRRYDEMNK